MKKILLPAFICLMLFSLGFLSVNAETEGIYTYTVSNNEATITDCDASGEIIIPSTLGGYPVTKIAAYTFGTASFSYCSGITKITIPKSVMYIGEGAFQGCNSLEEMTLPFIGAERGNTGTKEALLGYIFGQPKGTSPSTNGTVTQTYSLGKSGYFYIPYSLTKVTVTDENLIGYGAFSGNSNISEIILQGTVQGIGKYAFANHDKFINVIIKSENVKFADTSIFSDTDFATLYGYENSTVQEYASKYNIDFEPLAVANEIELSGTIKNINNMLVVHIDINQTVTDECLHISLYADNGQMVDYIIVPSDKPFNTMNVVFKDNKDSSYAKVFLWNGFTSMHPLTESKKIDIIR